MLCSRVSFWLKISQPEQAAIVIENTVNFIINDAVDRLRTRGEDSQSVAKKALAGSPVTAVALSFRLVGLDRFPDTPVLFHKGRGRLLIYAELLREHDHRTVP